MIGFRSETLALDLGSARTRLYVRGEGVTVDQPTMVGLTAERRPKVHSVGDEAQRLLGSPGGRVRAVRPVVNGAVADVVAAAAQIKSVMRQIGVGGLFQRSVRLVMPAPAGSTAVERESLQDAAISAGARRVYLFEQPLAAAIGAGLPVVEETPQLIAVLGAGVSEIAVLAEGAIIESTTVRVGGDHMNQALIAEILRNHSVLIDEPTADRLKRSIGVARMPQDGDGESATVRGFDVADQKPGEVTVNQREIADCLAAPISALVDALLLTLARVGREQATALVDGGLVLAGGGALLKGLDQALYAATGLPIALAETPALAVIRGVGIVIEETPDLRLLAQ
ncbi:MAG: rod shape-determining protein [Rhodospirillaceae bacterium]|nr:rod shape-determining protein [Rhodospirillaceae bacterium]